ncbi:helix-turn-helix domain-containing protein [Paenibacillus phoenicis]|uniref:Helix-turn-helix domain-containing protein n=1 Tax=Paenibacillus phoenicis TaxID=554117 RepID=A0ABU5PRI5_9BACL|nr:MULTISPECIES: TetR/AcrR family transcriptional regulator [Paenibacillus]EES73426.1 transcriptional regulator, TetR family [Paenibacillus sp. oral taxon 786 str. D14]MCT2195300.1 TetR/AcrR family transcriptional regulator [Paenibacillus sp. p3-SID1389]MEA3572551.1 helix-turn-helix domain-containing protein [Paenibacillus phoenicis]
MSEKKEQWLEDLIRLTEEDTEKKTEKQIKILEAATEIFAEKGYAATSTSEIAQKAGVAEGTIFRHYKTKKDLLLSIAGPIVIKLVAPFLLRDFAKMIEMPYERAEDFFRALAKDRFKFVRENMRIIKILIQEVPFQPELLEQVKSLASEIVFQRIKRVVLHFQEKGQLVEAPPWRIVRTGASVMIGMILVHVLLVPDFPIDEDEEIEHTVDLLMYGIAGRPR